MEVLLSITILGIMSVLILGVMINGISLVTVAGDLDKAGQTAAKVTENAIGGMEVDQAGTSVTLTAGPYVEEIQNTEIQSEDAVELTITFNGASPSSEKEIVVPGAKKTITNHGNSNDVKIEVFIPSE